MNKSSSHQSGIFTLRVLCAVALLAIGCSLAVLTFAANPSGGNLSPGGGTAPWLGTAGTGPPTAGGEGSCTEGVNCDSYTLTINGTPADWIAANKRVHVEINWLSPSSDYDLFIHKGTLAGPVIAESASGGSTKEQVNLDPGNPSIGTGVFTVHTVYFAATNADQYNGVATVIAGATKPIPAPVASGVFPPRFENYNPPAAGLSTLGLRSGEPSIGVGKAILGHPEGRAIYQSDVQSLRVTFNDCSFPRALWENKPAPTSQQDFDPILWSDSLTGRTIVHLLTFAGNVIAGESSVTDTDGDIWVPSTGAGIASGVDHQTVGGGAYNETSVPPPPPVATRAYPNAVYYCSQALVDASCARSDDGGVNYGPSFITYRDECGGLHGHVKVSPDGSVYLPNKGCGSEQAAVVSENNGITWSIRPVPGSASSGSDPSVAADAAGKIYFAYADGDTKAVVTTSTNHGQNWSQPLDVGAVFGINNVAYPAFIGGSAGRAAVAFLGTPTTGGLQGNEFRGVWHLYLATTYDGGATWSTVDATPADAVQRGCIWEGGGANVCRNMLDFIDATIDHEGRVLVGYADGCAGAECAQARQTATGNSYTALAAIARQSGGKRLLAAFDAAPNTGVTLPGTPAVTALRNGGVVHLAWSEADNGGSSITGYNVYRSITSNTETLLASVPGTQLRFDDGTATDPTKTYFYKVEALNAQGPSCKENEVSSRYVGDSRSLAGFTLAADSTGDQVGGPANADLDVQSLSISEPASGPYAGMLVFNLKVADLSLIPDQRMWRIVWNDPRSVGQQYYVGMTKNGTITYDYGTVATATVGLVLGLPSTTRVGTPDFGGFDPNGLITIAIAKNKVGNVQTGDILGAFSARTYANVGNEIRSTTAADTTANAVANDLTASSPTYAVVGPISGVSAVVSRKTHLGAGTFDIDLPLAGPGATEPRRSPSGAQTIVFKFVNPLTSVSGVTASATPFGGSPQPVAASGSIGADPQEYIVQLSSVPNPANVTVTVTGVADSLGNNTPSLPVTFGALIGDTTNDRVVNTGDAQQTRNRSGQIADGINFRSDVNLDGVVNSGDSVIVRSQSGTAPGAPERNATR